MRSRIPPSCWPRRRRVTVAPGARVCAWCWNPACTSTHPEILTPEPRVTVDYVPAEEPDEAQRHALASHPSYPRD